MFRVVAPWHWAFATKRGKCHGSKAFFLLHFIHHSKLFYVLVFLVLSFLLRTLYFLLDFLLPFFFFFLFQELYAFFKSLRSISNGFLNVLISRDSSLGLLNSCYSGNFLSTPFCSLCLTLPWITFVFPVLHCFFCCSCFF